MSTNQFEIDTSDYLGYKYDQYVDKLYAMALSKTSDYYTLRDEVVDKVKIQSVGKIYKLFNDILSDGTVDNVQVIKINNVNVKPCYPRQEVSKISLKASRTLDAILNEVIDIILPKDHLEIANLKSLKVSQISSA